MKAALTWGAIDTIEAHSAAYDENAGEMTAAGLIHGGALSSDTAGRHPHRDPPLQEDSGQIRDPAYVVSAFDWKATNVKTPCRKRVSKTLADDNRASDHRHHHAFAGLAPGTGLLALLRAYALAIGFVQMGGRTELLDGILRETPELSAMAIELGEAFQAALTDQLRALAVPDTSGGAR
jgi:hypothetical protein